MQSYSLSSTCSEDGDVVVEGQRFICVETGMDEDQRILIIRILRSILIEEVQCSSYSIKVLTTDNKIIA